ncbi:helix-turn-helix transcriptional regulator [bacterium]|nr:helix-turn-helix transcriptional regulator [bacterium]
MLYDDKKFIGSVIKNARKKAKLSQAELSEQIEMCDKNLGNIENGKQFPAVNNFLRIIEVLNLSLKDFGVMNTQKESTFKNELLKMILNASESQSEAYLDILNTAQKYLN